MEIITNQLDDDLTNKQIITNQLDNTNLVIQLDSIS
jgi:hypothetical protein